MIDYISGLVRCNDKKEFKVFCKKWNLVPYCHGGDLYEIASYKTGMDESLLDELKEVCYDINTEYTDENGDKFKFTMTNRIQGLCVFSDDVHDKLLEKGFNEEQVDTIIKVLRDLNENH